MLVRVNAARPAAASVAAATAGGAPLFAAWSGKSREFVALRRVRAATPPRPRRTRARTVRTKAKSQQRRRRCPRSERRARRLQPLPAASDARGCVGSAPGPRCWRSPSAPPAAPTGLDLDREHAFESLRPRHRGVFRHGALGIGSDRLRTATAAGRGDRRTQRVVWSEHPVVPREMGPRPRHERGEAEGGMGRE